MAADEARAERIRTLRESLGLKWRELSDYVGVSERSAHAWGATGAISQANAIKLAELFRKHGAEIEADYVWRGEQPATPDLMKSLQPARDAELSELHSKMDDLQEAVDRIEGYLQEQASKAVRDRVRRAARQRRRLRDEPPEDQAAADG